MSTAHSPSPFVRLTILGTRRNADVVLPTREPLHVLMPSVLDLLDEPDRLAEYDIARVEGGLLDLSRPLADTGVEDGQILRLTARQETPRDPEVYDVIEATQAYTTSTPGLWEEHRAVGAALVAAPLLLAAAVVHHLAAHRTDAAPLATTAIGCAALSVVASLLRQPAPAWLAWAAGSGLAAWALVVSGLPAALTVVAAALVIALAGVCSGHRRALGGAAVAILAVAAGANAVHVRAGSWLLTAGVVGVGLVVALGLVPRLALSVSGVFRLDASVTEGRRVRLHQARRSIEEAHWAVAATVCVLSAGMAGVAWVIGTQERLRGWHLALALLLTASWALRARHLPLVVERVACSAASAALVGAVAVTQVRADEATSGLLTLLLLGAGVVIALWHLLPVSEYSRAITRRWTDRVEAAAVIALLPVLVGAFGVYADLARSFS